MRVINQNLLNNDEAITKYISLSIVEDIGVYTIVQVSRTDIAYKSEIISYDYGDRYDRILSTYNKRIQEYVNMGYELNNVDKWKSDWVKKDEGVSW